MICCLQRNKNISLNYYDFPNHFSALCFLEKNRERSVQQKKYTVGHLKINVSRKYTMLLFFSEKCKKVHVYAHELKFDWYISLFNQMQKCMSH